MKKSLLIFGGKSTAIEIRESVLIYPNLYDNVLLVVPDDEIVENNYDHILNKDLDLYTRNYDCKYIIGFTNIPGRLKVQKKMKELNVSPTNVIDPSSFISETAKIGKGNFISSGAILSHKSVIGNHCIVHYHVSIGHDSHIEDNSIFLPGSRISGNVKIGNRVLVGSNSFVFQGKKIGDDCIIDAMTYVDSDMEENHIGSSRRFNQYKRVV